MGKRVTIKATIFYAVDNRHPDIEHIKNPSEIQSFWDIYYLDSDYFESRQEMENYIKNDLRLVAGGGYDTKHIHKVRFEFE